MKSFLILFSLFIVGSVCELTEDRRHDELEIRIMRLLHRLPQPVLLVIRGGITFSGNTSADLDQKCPHSSESFIKALDSVIECADATDPSLPICTALKTRLITCFTPVINVTENCMPDKSKGVPTLIAESIVSGISHLCGMTGEQMLELFSDCMMQPTNIKDKDITKELQGKMERIKDDLSVKNICSTGPEIRNLIKEYLGKVCQSQLTQAVYTEMIDALLKPCTAANEA